MTVPTNVTLRTTYPQDWTAYNAAQCSEKTTFMPLLADLCASVPQPPASNGRPRLPISDMLFTVVYKVYSGFSSRRFCSDIEDAFNKGFIDCKPSFASVNRYLADPTLTPILKELVEVSAEPLSGIEDHIAIDSTAFSTSRFDRWHSAKWGRTRFKRQYMKAHVAVGALSNIVTAIEVTDNRGSDTSMFRPLMDTTARRFHISEVSADKAYSSDANVRHAASHGAYPYIPFKRNTTGQGSPMWRQLYAHFVVNEQAFMRRYHQRSNVETTFMMVKTKFGDSVRSKSDAGQVNEIYAKFLCHNLAVLIKAAHTLGIQLPSESKGPSDSKVIDLSQYR